MDTLIKEAVQGVVLSTLEFTESLDYTARTINRKDIEWIEKLYAYCEANNLVDIRNMAEAEAASVHEFKPLDTMLNSVVELCKAA